MTAAGANPIRQVAFLRGVMPTNLGMAQLRQALEDAGLARVRTVGSSGNAVFDADVADGASLVARVESAIERHVGRRFAASIRSVGQLQRLLQADPWRRHGLPDDAKRVVSFLPALAQPRVPLPLTQGCATVIEQIGDEAYTAYRPTSDGPVFMTLIERAYGRDVTTRTWDTVRRCAAA